MNADVSSGSLSVIDQVAGIGGGNVVNFMLI